MGTDQSRHEISFFLLPGARRHHSVALFIAGYKDSAVGGDVLQRDSSGRTEDQTLVTR